MPGKLTLYVCHIDDGGPPPHACRRAQRALRDAGHEFEKVIFAKGRPFGLFTKGRRPELKAMSGQEKLPVLELPDGQSVNGGARIVAWARSTTPAPAGPSPGENEPQAASSQEPVGQAPAAQQAPSGQAPSGQA